MRSAPIPERALLCRRAATFGSSASMRERWVLLDCKLQRERVRNRTGFAEGLMQRVGVSEKLCDAAALHLELGGEAVRTFAMANCPVELSANEVVARAGDVADLLHSWLGGPDHGAPRPPPTWRARPGLGARRHHAAAGRGAMLDATGGAPTFRPGTDFERAFRRCAIVAGSNNNNRV